MPRRQLDIPIRELPLYRVNYGILDRKTIPKAILYELSVHLKCHRHLGILRYDSFCKQFNSIRYLLSCDCRVLNRSKCRPTGFYFYSSTPNSGLSYSTYGKICFASNCTSGGTKDRLRSGNNQNKMTGICS